MEGGDTMINSTMTNNRNRTYENDGVKNNGNLTRTPGRAADKPIDRPMDIPPIDQFTGESVMPSDSLLVPLVPATGPQPTANISPKFSQGYLIEHIGQNVRVEFLIGSEGALIDRTGRLVEVGENYIVLQPFGTDDLLMCDLFSIKFVTISR